MLHLRARQPNADRFKSSVEQSRHPRGTLPDRRRSGRSLENEHWKIQSCFSLVNAIRMLLLQCALLIPASSQSPKR